MVGWGISMWVLTLGSLPAPTYLISPITPTRPHPVAPVGQLALALLGSGPISGIMLFAFDKSHRKEREKGARGREGGRGQEGGNSRVSGPPVFLMGF